MPCQAWTAVHRMQQDVAQLALLQATHSHIGGGHYSFSMPSGTDNSATEASLNKLFTLRAVNSLLGSRAQRAAAANTRSGKELRVAYASALRALHCQAEAFSCVRLMRPGARNIWQLLQQRVAASASSLTSSRFAQKRAVPNRMLTTKRVQCHATLALPGTTPL